MIYGIISQQDNKCKPLVTKKTQNLGFTKFWVCKIHPRAVFLNKILHGALNYALYTEEILKFLRCIFYDSKKILQNQNYVFDRKIDRWMGINGVESLKPDIFEMLRWEVGCQFISELRVEPNLTIAKRKLRRLPLETCTLRELLDLAEYLYRDRL